MSRRKKNKAHRGVEHPEAPPAVERVEAAEPGGATLLRRILLGAITGLIVARPLVLGEDPGLLLKQYTDASGLVLTLLWFVSAVGWAVWRAWSGQSSRHSGGVEVALFAVVGLVLVSTYGSAAYQHPAWLITWEWLALLAAFALVRRLARTEADNQRLLAAMLASAVSLSAYAIYQFAEELPSVREFLAKEAAAEGLTEADQRILRLKQERVDLGVYATFAHPNSFAGYLALLLPAGIGWALVCGRRHGRSWRTVGVWVCALLLAGALALTKSKGAILGTLLIASAYALLLGRRFFWEHRGWILVGLLMLVGVAFLASARGVDLASKTSIAFDKRLDYWAATWKMIGDRDHPRFFWLGVGPGNFSRYYPRFMLPTAFEDVTDPHNFALEMWSTCGLFALIALLVALAAFFTSTWRVVRDSPLTTHYSPLTTHHSPLTTHHSATRWEFYLGGMFGLTLGFLLWVSGQSGPGRADAILVGGVLAAVRSVIWFATFALLESVIWSGPSRVLALTAGVAALLVNLTVSGGISFPSVALPLWVMMALTLNALPASVGEAGSGSFVARWRAWISRHRVATVLPIPVLGALCLTYLFAFFQPATSCDRGLKSAKAYEAGYRALLDQRDLNVSQEREVRRKAHDYLRRYILAPLREAAREDRWDAAPPVQLAHWYGVQWKLVYDIEDREVVAVKDAALLQADRATQLDPEGADGYLALYKLNMLFAGQAEPKTRELLHAKAAKALRQAVAILPNRAELRYQLAEALFLSGNAAEGRRQAEIARDLDTRAPEKGRRLTDPQRQQIRQWLEAPIASRRP